MMGVKLWGHEIHRVGGGHEIYMKSPFWGLVGHQIHGMEWVMVGWVMEGGGVGWVMVGVGGGMGPEIHRAGWVTVGGGVGPCWGMMWGGS